MFTNWLTNSLPHNNNNNNNQHQIHFNSSNNNNTMMPMERSIDHNLALTAPHASTMGTSMPPLSTNASAKTNIHSGGILSSTAPNLLTTPPDVVLEVGPAPSVRFVAHSIVLGMHSGYLRSAIRLDEQQLAAGVNLTNRNAAGGAGVGVGVGTAAAAAASAAARPDLVLYLNNVSAEQFAPLLTYMYTGYLELNVENIFGVLLATHLLHMPRPLEICRSFLANLQATGYLNTRNGNAPSVVAPPPLPGPAATALPIANSTTNNNNLNVSNKIIRPIASKAALPHHLGFIAPPMTPHVALTALGAPTPPLVAPTADYKRYRALSPPIATAQALSDSEDEEVFIDSNDDCATTDDMDCNVSITSSSSRHGQQHLELEVAPEPDESEILIVTEETQQEAAALPAQEPTPAASALPAVAAKSGKTVKARGSNSAQTARRRSNNSKTGTTSGLQVAKAPILACELDAARCSTVTAERSTASKFVIDVASCDGPVRFRRILNSAYGHKPVLTPADNRVSQDSAERTQQSVSLSFHQQMTRAINQQRQQQRAEELENNSSAEAQALKHNNSGNNGVLGKTKNQSQKSGSSASGGIGAAAEIYVCVYCKHSFKSQYCYQKHAKRHLNPLTLSTGGKTAATLVAASRGGKAGTVVAAAAAADACGTSESSNCSPLLPTTSTTALTNVATLGLPLPSTAAAAAAELLRREVRPLDMNVQYYPCKTCGSKFPSYYFVHKHRKMCHADELEAATTEGETNRRSGRGGSSNEATAGGSSGNRATLQAESSGRTLQEAGNSRGALEDSVVGVEKAETAIKKDAAENVVANSEAEPRQGLAESGDYQAVREREQHQELMTKEAARNMEVEAKTL